MQHLEDYENYSEHYDRMTVAECRQVKNGQFEEFKLRLRATEHTDDAQIQRVARATIHQHLYRVRGERYRQKAETIRKWMEEDKAKDEYLKNATPPDPIYCKRCKARMELQFRSLMYQFNKSEVDEHEATFFYRCPNANFVPKAVWRWQTSQP